MSDPLPAIATLSAAPASAATTNATPTDADSDESMYLVLFMIKKCLLMIHFFHISIYTAAPDASTSVAESSPSVTAVEASTNDTTTAAAVVANSGITSLSDFDKITC